MPLVIVDKVQKVYDTSKNRVPALRGVSFEVEAGQFIALRGPSGCGKSTLLHLAGGMDRPTGGKIVVGGIDLQALNDNDLASFRRRKIGFVFQFFNLLPTLTVLENVTLPLILDGAAESQAQGRARILLERVGLLDRVSHFPSELSGGEMQRTAVARALVAEPSLLLADEPTGNLDSENGSRVLELLFGLNRELGITILLATHSDEASGHANRLILMRDGLVEQDRILSPQYDGIPQAL